MGSSGGLVHIVGANPLLPRNTKLRQDFFEKSLNEDERKALLPPELPEMLHKK
jgi:hypothetical protein